MLPTKYYIVRRYMSGVSVVGYELQSVVDGSNIRETKDTVSIMALNKQIINCKAQKYRDPKTHKETIVLKGVGCKLSELPSTNLRKAEEDVEVQGEIVGRIVDGKHTAGYLVMLPSGKSKNISRKNTLELARKGRLKNARAQRSGGKLLLRGVNCELAKLPVNTLREAQIQQ